MAFGGGSCIISPAGNTESFLMAACTQWPVIRLPLGRRRERPVPFWKERVSKPQRREPDVSAMFAGKEQISLICWRCTVHCPSVKHSASETVAVTLLAVRKPNIFLFELFCAVDFKSGVIKWCLTARLRKGPCVMHFYIKRSLPTNFLSQTDKEIWIEIKQTEVSSNRSGPLFASCRNYHFSVHIIYPLGITNQLLLPCFVHISSTHCLIPLSSEWEMRAAWCQSNMPHICIHPLMECYR